MISNPALRFSHEMPSDLVWQHRCARAAILCVALREARRLGNGRNVVAVLPDDGYKYLSTNLYSDEEDVALRAQL